MSLIDTSIQINENFPACLSFLHPGGISSDGQTLVEAVGGRTYDLGGDPPDTFTRTGNYFNHSASTPGKMDIVAGGQLKLEAPTTATYVAIIVADGASGMEVSYGWQSTYIYFGTSGSNTDWIVNDGAGGDVSMGVTTSLTGLEAMSITANSTNFLCDHVTSGTWANEATTALGLAAGSITFGNVEEGFHAGPTVNVYGAALFQFNSYTGGTADRQAALEHCNTNWRNGVYTLPPTFSGLLSGG